MIEVKPESRVGRIRSKGLKGVTRAAVRRIVPNSSKYGYAWVTMADGSITFRERGFVDAPSPALLLARHNYEIDRIDLVLRDVYVDRSLEIGCGFGRLSMSFGRHAVDSVAIDINEDALEAARNAYPQVDYRCARAEALPFADASFGLVCTWTVLQHLPPERFEDATKEIVRVLAPEGRLLICEETRLPDTRSTHTWHRRVEDYERAFGSLQLRQHGYIETIDRIPGLISPGELMLFEQFAGSPVG